MIAAGAFPASRYRDPAEGPPTRAIRDYRAGQAIAGGLAQGPARRARRLAISKPHDLRRIGLEPAEYGTHSLRRTKVSMLNRKAGNLRASQLLLGHTKLESTARYLGVELDDAFASRKRSKSNIFECSLPLAVMYVGPHVTHSAPHRLSTLRLRDSCSRSKAEGDCYV